MRKGIAIGAVGTVLVSLAVTVQAGRAPKVVARPQRKIEVISVQKIIAVALKEGRVIEGTVSWPKASLGKPTGTAAEACSRVSVSAMNYTPDKTFGEDAHTEGSSTGTPVDPNDVTKGCNYKLTNLPAEKSLAIDGFYGPGEKWNPKCTQNIWECSNDSVPSVTLPKDKGSKVSIDITLNFVECDTLH